MNLQDEKTKPNKSPKKKTNQRGFSLVESLVAVGVMSIAMMGFMQMMANQQKEIRALEETMARQDIEKTLNLYMADGNICGATLAGPSPKTFNTATAASTDFSISSIPSGTATGALPLAEIGKQVSPISNSLKVASITYKNITPSSVNKYYMDLEVAYTGGVRPLRPSRIKMNLNTTTVSPGVEQVAGCSSGAASASASGSGMTVYPGTTCPAGTNLFMKYWESKACSTGSTPAKKAYWATYCPCCACTTPGNWTLVAPSCIYGNCTFAVPGGTATAYPQTCTADTVSKVLCL